MATKNNPGTFNCYAAAAPDEPLFVLRANDELAPCLVAIWACLRARDWFGLLAEIDKARRVANIREETQRAKLDEAWLCVTEMKKWKAGHGK